MGGQYFWIFWNLQGVFYKSPTMLAIIGSQWMHNFEKWPIVGVGGRVTPPISCTKTFVNFGKNLKKHLEKGTNFYQYQEENI